MVFGTRAAGFVVLAVVFLAVSGVGYASNSSDGGKQKQEQLTIQWTGTPTATGSPTFVGCSIVSQSSSILAFQVKSIVPGGSCKIGGTIMDTSSFGGVLTSSWTITPPKGCTAYTFTDNIAGKSIAAHGTVSATATLTLSSSAGPACTQGSATVVDTITAQCAKGDNCCE